jgi:hypothetical protein
MAQRDERLYLSVIVDAFASAASSIAVHASRGVRQTSAGVSTLHVLNFRSSWP